MEKKSKKKISTRILHSYESNNFSQGIHAPVDPSVTFHYQKTQDLIAAFQGKLKGFTYSRAASPKIADLEKKITILEQGRESICFATGMAAIAATCLAFLKKGDHVLASWFLFGNTYNFFKTLIRLGIEVDFVNVTKASEVKKKIKKNTKLFFLETIANPNNQIPEWEKIAEILYKKKIVSVIDNTLTSAFLFQPQKLGFSISLNSLTKYIAGHGAVLGGAITDLGNYPWDKEKNIYSRYQKSRNPFMTQIRKRGLRDMGATLAPESAHSISLGLETLALRMEKQCQNASIIARYLNEHPAIEYVHYPGLEKHPQHKVAKKYYRHFGALLSFKVKKKPLEFCDNFKLILRASHLGDNRTLSIPVTQTIFHEASTSEKKKIGVDENLIRLSVGIEDSSDLLEDLEQSFKGIM